MEEVEVVLRRRDDPSAGLGLSLLDKPGLPAVIFDIEENSPAAECGQVEAGDVIVKVNDTDVGKYSIKEDQILKEKILLHLSSTSENASSLTNGNGVPCVGRPVSNKNNNSRTRLKDFGNHYSSSYPPLHQDITTSVRNMENELTLASTTSSSAAAAASGNQPLCEAYVMTGERVLKLSKNTSLTVPKGQKKVDSLKTQQNYRSVNASAATVAATSIQGGVRHNKSTPSSPVDPEYDQEAAIKCSSASTSPITLGAPLKLEVTAASSSSERNTVATYGAAVSKSDDHIQYRKQSVSVSSTSVQVDNEDITSSLNTLLSTNSDDQRFRRQQLQLEKHHHKTDGTSDADELDVDDDEDQRVLWSCTAAVRPNAPHNSLSELSATASSPSSGSSSAMSSASSISSSSAASADRRRAQGAGALPNHPPSHHHHHHHHHLRHHRNNHHHHHNNNNRMSPNHNKNVDPGHTEDPSNLSSPDYQEEMFDLLNSADVGFVVADPGNDTTLLASEPKIRRLNQCVGPDAHKENGLAIEKSGHRIVIQIPSENDDELIALTEGAANLAKSISPTHCGSPEEEFGSDVESLHSFHYSPKGVDYPSAHRLAKRLYYLDGFKKSDVSRHLSKNNEFNRAVAEEYLKHFNFVKDSLDAALRKFLRQFSLTGETQERERVLVHFSKHYLDCNPGSFNSPDAVHTLTCAIMLLNTDLHGQNIGRKMTCNAFIENLAGLNDGENFPREILKALYQDIKNSPLEWAVDDDIEDNMVVANLSPHNGAEAYDEPNDYIVRADGAILKKCDSNANGDTAVIDYKKGYVLRKCCYDANRKRTPLGKRGWKMMHSTLRDLVLYLHKDEQELNQNQSYGLSHNIIKLHHALATEATDYKKKTCVFRLQTADRAEFLFQTSDVKELQSWIDTINLVCASFSAPALPEPVGSLKKFQRPLLPSAPSKLNLREQLKEHELTVERLENDLENHRKQAPDKSSKNLVIQYYNEKESHLFYEVKRYKTYVHVLQSKLPQIMTSVSSLPLADDECDEENIMVSTMTEEEIEETAAATTTISTTMIASSSSSTSSETCHNTAVSVNRKWSKKNS